MASISTLSGKPIRRGRRSGPSRPVLGEQHHVDIGDGPPVASMMNRGDACLNAPDGAIGNGTGLAAFPRMLQSQCRITFRQLSALSCLSPRGAKHSIMLH